LSTAPLIEAKILHPAAGPPAFASDGAAGMDLRACIASSLIIAPGEVAVVNTGVAISIRDKNIAAILAPRSGLGIREGIVLANLVGVIDSDYQDEIRAALWNRGNAPRTIAPGERVCQMLFVPIIRARLNIVAEFSEITKRGKGGLGSTGRF
jgi:dUTP pyrophosphatase